MRLLLILFGYLFLVNSLAWSQEVAIDIPVNRLSPQQLIPLAEIYEPTEHLLLLETESRLQPSEPEHTLSTQSDHLTHTTALSYQKIRRIVYEAPLFHPHFLIRSELPRYSTGANIADNDHSVPEKLSSSWQLVY